MMAEERKERKFDQRKVEDQKEVYKDLLEDRDYEFSALDLLAQRTESMLIEWAAKRQPAEDRWIADAEQYAGLNDPATAAELAKRPGRSNLFIPLTREKTRALDARLQDALMPTDDPTWSMRPTPVPELPKTAVSEVMHEAQREWLEKQAAEQAAALEAAPEMAAAGGAPAPSPSLPGDAAPAPPVPPPMPEPTPLDQPLTEEQEDEINEGLGFQRVQDMLYERSVQMADGMRRLMHDQLLEGDYATVVQGLIYDMSKFGMGIVEGPVQDSRPRSRYRLMEGGKSWVAQREDTDDRPVFERVRPWNWFPDPDAVDVDDALGFGRLYRVTPAALRRLGKAMGFSPKAMRSLLDMSPKSQLIYSDFIQAVRSFEVGNTDRTENRYYLWKWSGPVEAEEFQEIAEGLGDRGKDLMKAVYVAGKMALGDDYEGSEEELDPLYAPQVVLWFCQGHALSMELHPLDSGEPMYNVCTLVPQESNLYGESVPSMMAGSQRWFNAMVRLTIDNSKIASIPAYYKSSDLVRVDGGAANVIEEGSVWTNIQGTVPTAATGIIPIVTPLNAQILMEVARFAQELMDSESLVPRITHGEGSAQAGQTAHGMTLLANAVNVMFRNMVRAFDTAITRPVLMRLYAWNMQRPGNDHLKGDMEPEITGTAALLVRDVQMGNLMMAIQMVAQNPTIQDALKDYPLIKRWVQVAQLNPEEVMHTERDFQSNREERLAREQAMAEAQGGDDNIKINLEQLRQDGVMNVEQLRKDTQEQQMASSERQAAEKNRVALETALIKQQSEDRKMKVEAALKARGGTGM